MKKLIVIISIFLYNVGDNLYAQVSMRMKEAEIVKYVILDDFEGGITLAHLGFWTRRSLSSVQNDVPPMIRLRVEMTNMGKDKIDLFDRTISCKVHYRYKWKEYSQEAKDYLRYPHMFYDGTAQGVSMVFDITFIPDIFSSMDEPLFKEGYGQMMLDILPTMTVECSYLDKEKFKVVSDFSDWDEINIIRVEPNWENIAKESGGGSLLIQSEPLKRHIKYPGIVGWDDIIIRKSSDPNRTVQ